MMLRGVTLSGAQLARTDLSGADLGGADLSNVQAIGTDFSKANLAFDDANLMDVSFLRADLRGAQLSQANSWRHADFTGAKFDERTRFPRGWAQPPPDGVD